MNELQEQYQHRLAKYGIAFDELDKIECPCEEEQSSYCKIYGAKPKFCKPVQNIINNLIDDKIKNNV